MAAPAPTARDELSDLDLRRAQRGDEAGFRALVDRYQGPVHHLVWRMVEHAAGSARADELTQETFVRVYEALPRFRRDRAARLSTWIFTIATRLALNELRRHRGRTTIPLAGNEATDAPSGEAHVARRQLRDAIRTAVAGLAPSHRAVLVLREFHDLDYTEIASVLELDLGTVKSRLSRARAAVRESLAETGHEVPR